MPKPLSLWLRLVFVILILVIIGMGLLIIAWSTRSYWYVGFPVSVIVLLALFYIYYKVTQLEKHTSLNQVTKTYYINDKYHITKSDNTVLRLVNFGQTIQNWIGVNHIFTRRRKVCNRIHKPNYKNNKNKETNNNLNTLHRRPPSKG